MARLRRVNCPNRESRVGVEVTSGDINAYLRTGAHMAGSAQGSPARDAAAAAAAAALAVGTQPTSRSGRWLRVTRAVGEVGRYPGDTPAVARASCVDSGVVWYLAETVAGRPDPGWEA